MKSANQLQTNRGQSASRPASTGRFAIIGSEAQVAATESRANLGLVRRIFAPARFSNGHRALIVYRVNTLREARQWLARSNSALAYVSGRLGRWLAPTFVIAESAELNRRMAMEGGK